MEFRPLVLIVDDDDVVRETLATVLAKTYNVHQANSAKLALEFLESQEPHAIISDIQMPEMDGITFLTKVKETYPYLPIILITGTIHQDLIMKALRAGAYDYLQKPISAKDLKFSLERAVKHRMLEFEKEVLLRRLNKSTSFPTIEVKSSLSQITTCCLQGLEDLSLPSKNDHLQKILELTQAIQSILNKF